MAADAVDINAVNDIVRKAVQSITVNKHKQKELEIKGVSERRVAIGHHEAQFVVHFLQENPHAVESLAFVLCTMTRQAVEIFRTYFASRNMSSISHISLIHVNLGNENGRRLFSGLHGNNSVTVLLLACVGLEGTAGGDILSTLLQNNSSLEHLLCFNLRLGVTGARALQPGIRGNHTLNRLFLYKCSLGDEGVSIIGDAMEENITINYINLEGNRITSNGLTHLTRLLQLPSLATFDLNDNPGLFVDEENTRLFASALRNSTVKVLRLSYCRLHQLPGHAITTLFQAVANHPTLSSLNVFDHAPLQGVGLARLQDNLPLMNLRGLHINLDYSDPAFLLSLCKNKAICHVYSGPGDSIERTTGAVFVIMKCNRRLRIAKALLDSELRKARMIRKKRWGLYLGQLARDEHGATAVYAVLREKLVFWWPPQTASTPRNTRMSKASSSSNSKKKRRIAIPE